MKEDDIENIVVLPLGKMFHSPMDDELCKLVIMSARMPKEDALIDAKKLASDPDTPFLVALMLRRIEACFTYRITDIRVLLFLALVAEGAGSAIMLLWYLQWYSQKSKNKTISWENICQEVFAHGIPSEASLHQIWRSQKVDKTRGMASDNLVDYAEAGKSLF